jgi:hypothetical protein
LDWIPLASAGGGWIVALILLFLSFRSGAILTRNQHDEIVKSKNDYIELLEKRNDKLDERNDVLVRGQERAIEVAETAGMVRALPANTAERLVR